MAKKSMGGLNSSATAMPQKSQKNELLQEKILENLISLQKVHTNLAEKFDKLSEQIGSLLNLFEMTAKTFATNPSNMVSEKDKEFLEKIDRLLDQNKTIAKGLTLMEERIRDRVYGGVKAQPPQQEMDVKDDLDVSVLNRPLPKF